MDTLDRVYNAFSNLDRDFARSKKSRSEFIIDKFGGDLDMGSMIILDAISAFKGEETPEDIEKLTFVKDIFAKIMAARDNLDSLHDFTFGAANDYNKLISILTESMVAGTGVCVLPQSELNKWSKGTVHFLATEGSTMCCDMMEGHVVHIYNENMQGYAERLFPHSQFELGQYFQRKSAMHAVPIKEGQLSKALR